jgi:hypothetical protein
MGRGERRVSALRSGPLLRTVGAVALLLLFWGALARSLWPEYAPLLLRALTGLRGGSGVTIETAHLSVRVASRAGEAAVREAIPQLEADLAAIEAVTREWANGPHPSSPRGGGEPGSPPSGPGSLSPRIKEGSWRGAARIPVTLVDGSGPALSDGQGLTLFYDGERIDLSTAPFFLALLREGTLSAAGLRLFVDGGYAVYVAEEAGRAGALLGQPSDAWVAVLRDAGTYVPVAEAWEAGLPRGEREMGLALRALLEGGSFVRWVGETWGPEAVAALRDGVPVEEVTGVPLAEAEARWLATVAGIESRDCAAALPEGSPLHGYCGMLEGER